MLQSPPPPDKVCASITTRNKVISRYKKTKILPLVLQHQQEKSWTELLRSIRLHAALSTVFYIKKQTGSNGCLFSLPKQINKDNHTDCYRKSHMIGQKSSSSIAGESSSWGRKYCMSSSGSIYKNFACMNEFFMNS